MKIDNTEEVREMITVLLPVETIVRLINATGLYPEPLEHEEWEAIMSWMSEEDEIGIELIKKDK